MKIVAVGIWEESRASPRVSSICTMGKIIQFKKRFTMGNLVMRMTMDTTTIGLIAMMSKVIMVRISLLKSMINPKTLMIIPWIQILVKNKLWTWFPNWKRKRKNWPPWWPMLNVTWNKPEKRWQKPRKTEDGSLRHSQFPVLQNLFQWDLVQPAHSWRVARVACRTISCSVERVPFHIVLSQVFLVLQEHGILLRIASHHARHQGQDSRRTTQACFWRMTGTSSWPWQRWFLKMKLVRSILFSR